MLAVLSTYRLLITIVHLRGLDDAGSVDRSRVINWHHLVSIGGSAVSDVVGCMVRPVGLGARGRGGGCDCGIVEVDDGGGGGSVGRPGRVEHERRHGREHSGGLARDLLLGGACRALRLGGAAGEVGDLLLEGGEAALAGGAQLLCRWGGARWGGAARKRRRRGREGWRRWWRGW
jgi:hypothetical protein